MATKFPRVHHSEPSLHFPHTSLDGGKWVDHIMKIAGRLGNDNLDILFRRVERSVILHM
jgi:hypothetical protein